MSDSLDAPVGVEDRPDTPEPSRPAGWSFARAADWARSRGPVARACAAVLLYAVVSVVAYGREALPHGFRDAIMLKKPFRPEDLFAAVEVLTHRAPGVVELRRKEV